MRIERGDTIIDCDPRTNARRGVVYEMDSRFVFIRWHVGRTSRILRSRIHTKGIRTGYRLEPLAALEKK